MIDETKDTSREQRVDLPGLFTSGLGLFALTFGLIEANSYGWSSGRIVGAFVVAAVALTAFVVLELRQRLPMLDLSLFRSGTFTGVNTVLLLVALAMFGVFFFISLYMQNILGYSAVQAGAAFLPLTLLVVFIAPIAGKVSDRVGSRWLLGIGMLVVACQLVYLSRLGVQGELLVALAGNAPRRHRNARRHDVGDRGRSERRAGRSGWSRLGCPQFVAPDRRLDRDRADRGDHGPRDGDPRGHRTRWCTDSRSRWRSQPAIALGGAVVAVALVRTHAGQHEAVEGPRRAAAAPGRLTSVIGAGRAKTDLAVTVRGLRKSYGSPEAVAGIDLAIARGEVFGLLGPERGGQDDHRRDTRGAAISGYRRVDVLGFRMTACVGAHRPAALVTDDDPAHHALRRGGSALADRVAVVASGPRGG